MSDDVPAEVLPPPLLHHVCGFDPLSGDKLLTDKFWDCGDNCHEFENDWADKEELDSPVDDDICETGREAANVELTFTVSARMSRTPPKVTIDSPALADKTGTPLTPPLKEPPDES